MQYKINLTINSNYAIINTSNEGRQYNMPYTNSHFDSLLAMTALLNDTELEALANKCQELIADRERIKRNELRQELMENLQKVIGDILHNNFTLCIKNTELDPDENNYAAVYFEPEDIYSIEIE